MKNNNHYKMKKIQLGTEKDYRYGTYNDYWIGFYDSMRSTNDRADMFLNRMRNMVIRQGFTAPLTQKGGKT